MSLWETPDDEWQAIPERQSYTCLNIGCGRDVREGWVNADLHPVDGRVMRVDADSPCWPWMDETFALIEARDLIEHLARPVQFLGECWRVLKPGGQLRIRGPHYTCRDTYTDLTHRRGLSSESLLWAGGGGRWTNPNPRPWSQIEVRLIWEWPFAWMRVLNLHPMLLRLYEATPLSAIPAKAVEAVLWK